MTARTESIREKNSYRTFFLKNMQFVQQNIQMFKKLLKPHI
jgi:hypothetical protein